MLGERIGSDGQGGGKGQLQGRDTRSDFYIVKTPSGGIPSADLNLTPPEVGSAKCFIYQINAQRQLIKTKKQEIVWNLEESEVSGDQFIRIAKDKFGRWHPIPNSCISRICRPRQDVDTGESMICDIQEGPIMLETNIGETLIALNTGSLIAADTRCEAIHYSCRRGGEPHLLTSAEVASFQSNEDLSDGIESTTADQYADYELFSLEC